jgi:hypothetical protein
VSDRPFPFGGFAPQAPDPESVAQAVATIAARDPRFNLDSFLAEAQQAFWLVGQAHAQCKPELWAGGRGAGRAGRERAAIEEACREGHITAPDDEDAESGQLVSIASDASHDTIVVHFTSRWRPVGGGRSGGRGKEEPHIENWCFQRPATAQTAQAAGAGDHCRNCGALLTESVGGTCRYCGTPIGAGDGWRVIRVDEVQAPEAASAVAAMRSIVAAMAVASQEQRAAGVSTATAPAAAAPRRRRGRGCLGPVLLVILVAIGLGADAVGSSGSLHRAVAKVFPSIRHPRLQGPLDVSGTILAQHVVATQVPPKFQSGGTCIQAAARTAWDFKAKLADGSAFHLQIGLPPGTGAPGVYKRPELSLTATAQNASRYESWTATAASTIVLTVQPGGGGDLQFSNMARNEPGSTGLSGHLTWACDLA